MRGCFLSILRRRASSDFESRYEWPRGIVRIGEGAEGGSYEIEGAGGYTMVWIGCVSILAGAWWLGPNLNWPVAIT